MMAARWVGKQCPPPLTLKNWYKQDQYHEMLEPGESINPPDLSPCLGRKMHFRCLTNIHPSCRGSRFGICSCPVYDPNNRKCLLRSQVTEMLGCFKVEFGFLGAYFRTSSSPMGSHVYHSHLHLEHELNFLFQRCINAPHCQPSWPLQTRIHPPFIKKLWLSSQG